MSVKKALTGELAPQYRKADKKKKTSLLDGFIQQIGYNRKYAPLLVTHWGKETFLMADGKPVKLKEGTVKRRKKIGKEADGNSVSAVYDKPVSPCQRLPASSDLSDAVKAELNRRYERYNPAPLQQEVHRAVDALMERNRQKALMRQPFLATAALENF